MAVIFNVGDIVYSPSAGYGLITNKKKSLGLYVYWLSSGWQYFYHYRYDKLFFKHLEVSS
jgi:hypothetical protein